jgi:hypothetical protein
MSSARNGWRDWARVRGWSVYDIAVFCVALVGFWTLLPFGDLDNIIGDNIAQVGFWRILFHHNLVGSVGASSMKPGLIVLLGGAHDLSMAVLGTTLLIKAVFVASAAGLAAIVARIARDVGGPIAGACAVVYLVTKTPVPEMFTTGTSMIVFLPLLLWGIWLFSVGREYSGAVVLCLAALVRIEAFAVLLWLAVAEQLLRRKWRPFLVSSLIVAITVVFTVAVYYRVQGSVARFNTGGPTVGYIFSRDPSALSRLVDSLRYTASSVAEMLIDQCGFPYLAVPALLGVVLSPTRRFYLSLLGIAVFLILYITAGGGNTQVRYFQFLAPVTAAFGAAGIARIFRLAALHQARIPRWLWALAALAGLACFALGWPNLLCSLSLCLIVAAAGALHVSLPCAIPTVAVYVGWSLLFGFALLSTRLNGGWGRAPKLAPYTQDAISLLEGSPVPRGARVLTEDDVIYGVLVKDHELFGKAAALQCFNTQDDARRAEMLGESDYIIVFKRKFHFYYLSYDPLSRGKSDPFRAAILGARNGAKTASIYGHRLRLVENTRQRLVLKIEPETKPG